MATLTRGLAVLSSVLLIAACSSNGSTSDDPDVVATAPEGFAATPQYLATVAEQSGALAYRFDMAMTFAGTPSMDVAEGAVDGDRMAYFSNPELLELGIIRDGSDVYFWVPFLLKTPDLRLDAATSELKDLVEPADGWLMIDYAQMTGYTLEEAEELVMGDVAQQDPTAMIDAVANAQDAEELEPQEIQGEMMVGIAAEAAFVDLLEAEGSDPEGFVELMSASFDGMLQDSDMPPELADTFVETLFEVMLELNMTVDVWIDEAGYLRQAGFEMNMAGLIAEVDARIDDLDLPPLPPSANMVQTMNFFDYGEDLDIELPEDAADLTDRPELFDYWALTALAE